MNAPAEKILRSALRLASGDKVLREHPHVANSARHFVRKESSILLRRAWRYWLGCRFRRVRKVWNWIAEAYIDALGRKHGIRPEDDFPGNEE